MFLLQIYKLCTVCRIHGEADAVKHKPGRLLSDADDSGQFLAADTVFAVGHRPDRDKPFIDADRRRLKDRADLGA